MSNLVKKKVGVKSHSFKGNDRKIKPRRNKEKRK